MMPPPCKTRSQLGVIVPGSVVKKLLTLTAALEWTRVLAPPPCKTRSQLGVGALFWVARQRPRPTLPAPRLHLLGANWRPRRLKSKLSLSPKGGLLARQKLSPNLATPVHCIGLGLSWSTKMPADFLPLTLAVNRLGRRRATRPWARGLLGWRSDTLCV